MHSTRTAAGEDLLVGKDSPGNAEALPGRGVVSAERRSVWTKAPCTNGETPHPVRDVLATGRRPKLGHAQSTGSLTIGIDATVVGARGAERSGIYRYLRQLLVGFRAL